MMGAHRKAGISDATCYTWRKITGEVGRTQLAEKNARLMRIVADLELEKLTSFNVYAGRDLIILLECK